MRMLRTKLRRDVLADKWLFLAATVVIVLGVAMFASSLLAFENLRTSYDYTYERLRFADFTVKVVSAPASVVNDLGQMPGVQAVTGRANVDVGLRIPGESGQSLVVRAISIPSNGHPEVNDLKIEEGRYPSPGDKRGLLLEKSLAQYHNLRPGDSVSISGPSAQADCVVDGIATSPEYIFPAKSRNEMFASPATWGVVFIPEELLPQILGTGDPNEFCVLISAGADLDSVIGQFQAMLSPYHIVDVVTRDEQPSNAGLKMDLQEFGEIADIFPMLFLFVGAMTTYILVTRIIQRERRQVGLIRALGYSRRQVLLHYISFALAIGVVGAVLGVLAGYLLSNTITDLYVGMLGLPYAATGTHWAPIEEGLFIGILPTLIAGLFPALAATRLGPAEAMRTPPPAAGRKPLLEKAFPFLGRLSLLWRIPIRNIFRNRYRSISTVLGVVFGTVLILSSAGFTDSMDNLFRLQFDEVQRYDARLVFADAQPVQVADRVRAWPGVKEAAPILELPTRLEYGGKSFATLVQGMPSDTALYGLYRVEGDKTAVTTGQVLLAGAIREKLGIQAGDVVRTLSPFGEADLVVGGFVRQPMGSFGFVTLATAQELAGGRAVVSGVLLGADADAIPGIQQRASREFDSLSVEITAHVRERMMGLMNLVYAMMWVMLAFGAVLAFMVVFTMVTISLIERRREIATMRTLGQPRSRIAAMVTIENLILGAFGLVLGIPMGYAVAYYLMSFLETDMFTFELTFYRRTYLVTAGAVLAIMLLTQIPGIRSLGRLDLAKVTKEQVS